MHSARFFISLLKIINIQKKQNYEKLAWKVKHLWWMEKVHVIPIVVGALMQPASGSRTTYKK